MFLEEGKYILSKRLSERMRPKKMEKQFGDNHLQNLLQILRKFPEILKPNDELFIIQLIFQSTPDLPPRDARLEVRLRTLSGLSGTS